MASADQNEFNSLKASVDKTKRYDGFNDNSKVPSETESKRCVIGSRHVFAFMSFIGLASVLMCRVNLSVAIVHMVQHPNVLKNVSAFPSLLIDTDHCLLLNDKWKQNEFEWDAEDGEFNWNSRTQGLILASFYWGYIMSQIPAGVLAEKYGGKYVFGIGVLLSNLFTLLTLLTPVAARSSANALIAMRILIGFAEGWTLPAMHNMLSKWVPVAERSTIGSFVLSGVHFGTVISMPASGFLCSLKADNGWPWAFYVPGSLGVVWFIAWVFLIFDSPQNHPRIDSKEKKYICDSIGSNIDVPLLNQSTPWYDILTSLPVWAILIAHLGKGFGYNVILTELPTYMKTVLHYDLHSNTILSAVPYLALAICSIGFSFIADCLRKSIISTSTTRKIFNSIGFLFPAIALVGASITGCDRVATVTLIVLAMGFHGATSSGFLINHIDIASNYAGILMGFSNSIAAISGFLAPYTVSLVVTTPGSLHQWQSVFFITAAIFLITGLFYSVFAKGTEQSWNSRIVEGERRTILENGTSL